MSRILATLLCLLVPMLAFAKPVFVKSALSDADFYKAVSCGASPSGACTEDVNRFAPRIAANLTIALSDPNNAASPALKAAIKSAMANAVQQINAAGSGLQLSLLPDGKRAKITIVVVSPDEMAMISTMRGISPGKGTSFIGWGTSSTSSKGRLAAGTVSIASTISLRDVNHVVLAQIGFDLGFSAITGGPYTRGSIFSGEYNTVSQITGQDRAALRAHYPK
ncbi:MAG: hypothetical protein ABI459_00825 [Deltaproteobacteria bacterium]